MVSTAIPISMDRKDVSMMGRAIGPKAVFSV